MKRTVAKKTNHKKGLDDLQDAVLFLSVALIVFFGTVVFNCPKEPISLKNICSSGSLSQVKTLKTSSLERIPQPVKAHNVKDVLKEQQKFLGQYVYLEGYLVKKYYCPPEKETKCDKDVEDFLIISDFNKKVDDYLIKSDEDTNRIIVRAKSIRMPADLINQLKEGEKFIIAGEFIDNLVIIGETTEGKPVEGLMLVYNKLALAK